MGEWDVVQTPKADPWAVKTPQTQRHSPEDIARTREIGMKRITGIPAAIGEVFHEGVEGVKSAFEPVQPGELGGGIVGSALGIPTAKRAMRLLGGAVDIVGAPAMGAFRSMISQPIEEATGISKRITEFPASFAAPIATTKAVTAGAKALQPAAKFLEKVFSPGSVDADARLAEGLIRRTGGAAARETAQTEAAFSREWDWRHPITTWADPVHRKINQMDDAQRLAFIDYVEGRSRGVQLADRTLQPVADQMRTEFAKRMARLSQMPSTARMGFVSDYFPHLWEDPRAARRFIAKLGSGGFTKQRTVPTVADGLAAGLRLRTTDPLAATMEYVTNTDRFIAANTVIDEARALRTVKYFRPGSRNIPNDWVQLEGRLGKKSTPVGEMRAYAPEGFARVYNRFAKQSHIDASDLASNVYDKAQRASNAITALELGLSGFHAVTMANEAGISAMAKGIQQIVGGQVFKGLKSIGTAPVQFITSAMRGKKLEQVYLGRTTGTADMREMANLLEQAGGRATGFQHARDYHYSAMNSYWTSWRRAALAMETKADLAQIAGAPISGSLKVGFRHMGRILRSFSQPLFESYIPHLKNGAFYDTMRAWMELNPAATHEQKVAQARTIWNSIDNRFGEMVQDNIFWGKTSKQVAQLMMRSYSWNMGTVREIGGGAADIARGRWTPRAAYALALPMWVGSMNAAYQYLRTGKSPESIQDLLAGQTGGEQLGASVPGAKFGQRSTRATVPERVSIPGYQKDVMGWYEDWFQEAKNKIATGPRVVMDIMSNRDWKNDPIINPEASAPEWLKQYGEFATRTFGPIAIREALKGPKEGSRIGRMERAMGLRPAPTYLSDPEGHREGLKRRREQAWKRKEVLEERQRGQYGGPTE